MDPVCGIWDTKNHNDGTRAGREKDAALIRDSTHLALPYPHVTYPCVALAIRRNPVGDNVGWGHRYGLVLTDDGKTLSWTLDGRAMDTVDISGYFGSSPGCVADGAYAFIGHGGGFRRSKITLSDVKIHVSA